MRWDTAILIYLAGVASTLAAIGLAQVLVTKGYNIAADLVDAGWQARELRAHRKAAILLPWLQRMRAEGNSQR